MNLITSQLRPPASGSYLPKDVTLMVDFICAKEVKNVEPQQKEHLIQTGQQHYSDMITLEQPPTAIHEALYYQALAQGKHRMADEIATLAYTLSQIFKNKVNTQHPLIMVSLVRAGLPIGVLLQRALGDSEAEYSLASLHYGVSIIRDRGIDPVALESILGLHPHSPIVFIDGWTGKGAIYGELKRSLAVFSHTLQATQIFHQGAGVIPLVTLADPAGVAWLSASRDDWLMPASLLNSTISGLISRTLYRDASMGLHQAVFYQELQPYDKSLEFIDTIDELRQRVTDVKILTSKRQPTFDTQFVIEKLATDFAISNRNRIKPTLAEATRAILRRDPECVIINTTSNPDTMTDTALLRHLCQDKNLTIIENNDIHPYQAVTIIKQRQTP